MSHIAVAEMVNFSGIWEWFVKAYNSPVLKIIWSSQILYYMNDSQKLTQKKICCIFSDSNIFVTLQGVLWIDLRIWAEITSKVAICLPADVWFNVHARNIIWHFIISLLFQIYCALGYFQKLHLESASISKIANMSLRGTDVPSWYLPSRLQSILPLFVLLKQF